MIAATARAYAVQAIAPRDTKDFANRGVNTDRCMADTLTGGPMSVQYQGVRAATDSSRPRAKGRRRSPGSALPNAHTAKLLAWSWLTLTPANRKDPAPDPP
jgi:hypothetical protein